MSREKPDRRPLILLLEDDAGVRDLLVGRLESSGLDCVAAEVAEDALQIANHSQVDALVCDLMMRGMGGLWMIEAFARRFPERPIIVTTGAPPSVGSPEDQKLRSLVPADRMFRKPYRTGDLVVALNQALGRSSAGSGDASESGAALDVTALLGAMDGICYVVAKDGKVLMASEPAWSTFAAEGGWTTAGASEPSSLSLFDSVTNETVRQTVKAVHERVLSSGRVEYTYCCNGPGVERRMHMIATAVRSGDGPVAVLYQSRLLEAKVRPPVRLFETDRQVLDRIGDKKRPIITMCSYCQLIAWPVGQSGAEADWIETPQYYRQGGSDDVRVSHGVCPSCYTMLMDVA